MRTTGIRLNDLLGQLGLPGGWVGAQTDMLENNPTGVLKNLKDAYQETSLGRGTSGYERIMTEKGKIPKGGTMPSPGQMLPISGQCCGAGYHGGRERINLAGNRRDYSPRQYRKRQSAARRIEGILKNNKSARAAFENSVGGRIVSFGGTDGRMVIERFPPGHAPIPGMAHNEMAMSATGCLHGMEHSVGRSMGKLGLIGAGIGGGMGALQGLMMGTMMGNPFMGLAMGGLGGLLSGGFAGASAGAMGMGMMPGLGMGFLGNPTFGSGLGMGGFGALPFLTGGGMGSWNPLAMPGRIGNTNPVYEMAHQAQVSGVLMDPSLTVEDKVTLMIMLIMKKMDKDIERQAHYINSIQQQQSNRQKKGSALGMVGTVAGAALGGPMGAKLGGGVGGKLGGGGNSPSIDVETMKLKRMVDKRSQMFDMLRQIIDKYNETAKNVIQSIGR